MARRFSCALRYGVFGWFTWVAWTRFWWGNKGLTQKEKEIEDIKHARWQINCLVQYAKGELGNTRGSQDIQNPTSLVMLVLLIWYLDLGKSSRLAVLPLGKYQNCTNWLTAIKWVPPKESSLFSMVTNHSAKQVTNLPTWPSKIDFVHCNVPFQT